MSEPRADIVSLPRDLVQTARGSSHDLGAALRFFATATSTNDLAKEGARAGAPHGTVWICDEQTAGRGRQGRVWTSPAGENLTFSVLLRTPCPVARLPQLSLATGLAVRDAVASFLPDSSSDVKVKWPNDVHVRGKKIAGILVESSVAGDAVQALVIGIGMNVHTTQFPAEIAERATSLALCGVRRSRGEVLSAVLDRIAADVPLTAAKGLRAIHARLQKVCALTGTDVAFDGGEGTCEGIDDEGRLLVRACGGVLLRLHSGEVHLAPRAELEQHEVR